MTENQIVSIHQKGVQWNTTDQYRFLIDSFEGTLSQVAQKDVVKSSSIRRVLTAKIDRKNGAFEVFIKHHHLPWKEVLKDLLHISKAKNEWKLTHQIADLGINTVLPLAMGERRRLGLLRESYFVSKRIADCETLHDFVVREVKKEHGPSFVKWKRQLIRQLAVLIAEIHKKGVEHRDLHAGNILMEKIAEGDYKLRLIDLDRAHIYPRLSLRKRLFELAQFNMFFTLFVSQTDRLRFFKEYYQQDPTPWRGYQKGAKLVEAKTFKMVNRLYHRRDKMCLREGKYFSRFKTLDYSGYYRREWVQEPFVELLKKPDSFFNQSGAVSLKKASEKTVHRYPLKIGDQTLDVVIKSYKIAGLFGKVKDFVRSSKAKKCWYAANALYQRKIPTSNPLACITERKWGVRKSYFISEYLPNTSVLALYLQDRFGKEPLSKEDRKLKRQLLVRFARFVRRTHELWIYHGDLKASNIMIREDGIGNFQFYLIDLDHVKVCCTINRFQRYRNLMQLNKSFLDRRLISMTDRLAFLKAYLGPDSCHKRTLQRAWTVVTHLTARRLKKTSKAFSS